MTVRNMRDFSSDKATVNNQRFRSVVRDYEKLLKKNKVAYIFSFDVIDELQERLDIEVFGEDEGGYFVVLKGEK